MSCFSKCKKVPYSIVQRSTSLLLLFLPIVSIWLLVSLRHKNTYHLFYKVYHDFCQFPHTHCHNPLAQISETLDFRSVLYKSSKILTFIPGFILRMCQWLLDHRCFTRAAQVIPVAWLNLHWLRVTVCPSF